MFNDQSSEFIKRLDSPESEVRAAMINKVVKKYIHLFNSSFLSHNQLASEQEKQQIFEMVAGYYKKIITWILRKNLIKEAEVTKINQEI